VVGIPTVSRTELSLGDDVDSYFVLDTETGKLTTTPSFAQFQGAATQLGIHLKLERAYTVYSRYGLIGLAGVSPLITLLLSLAFVLLLARWIVQLRSFLRSSSNRTALPSY
jgi:Flp pilus assembly protein TadB